MKHFIYILTFLISAGLQGQDRSVDVEKVDQWLLDAVTTAFFETNVEVLPGFIFIQTKPGDRIAIWDASGLTHFEQTVSKEGESEVNTGFLLQGRYFLGIIKAGAAPMVKALDIGAAVSIAD
jgi:hypothetical protein